MTNLLLLAGCFAVGVLGRRFSGLPPDSHRVLNAWVMNVSLPALVLRSVHAVPLEPRLFLGAAMLWVQFLVAAGLALLALRRGWVDTGVAGALALSGGLGNTAFVGLPLLESLGGRAAMEAGTVVDQLGSFGVLALVAVPFAAALGGHRMGVVAVLRRVVFFPPFIALVLAFATRGLAFPAPFEGAISRLADMLSPLALASVGWQLHLGSLGTHRQALAAGLLYKLVLAPALVLGLLWLVHGSLGLEERVAVAESAMAPMVTSGVLASEHKLAPELASGMIAVGVVVSLVTVPLWWFLTGGG